jgi:mannose-6-phosphate isomerase-like protein (cupin superfamily)
MEKVDLDDAFDSFDERWSPRVVAELDDHAVKLAKVEGGFVWHSHAEADELFLVRSGELTIEFREREAAASTASEASEERAGSGTTRGDGEAAATAASEASEGRAVYLGPGELVVVPAGVEHRPVADGTAEILLFERTATRNTGDVEDERTVEARRLEEGDS